MNIFIKEETLGQRIRAQRIRLGMTQEELAEALLHGTEQFFMDDTSRNGEAHYGIGLFFAKTVAEKYGGGIKLSNSENTGGARVEIFFLSSQETS